MPRKFISSRCERLAIFDADPVPHLSINPRASTLNQLALHPGSGSERKNWPESKWADLLLGLIQSTRLNLLLIGGEAEGDRLQRLAAALPPTRLHVAQSLPLAELARLLQRCAAFVGHDSGISHLAAAVGLPGLVLWGDTAEEIWRPPHEKIVVIKAANGLTGITVKRVFQELRRLPELLTESMLDALDDSD